MDNSVSQMQASSGEIIVRERGARRTRRRPEYKCWVLQVDAEAQAFDCSLLRPRAPLDRGQHVYNDGGYKPDSNKNSDHFTDTSCNKSSDDNNTSTTATVSQLHPSEVGM